MNISNDDDDDDDDGDGGGGREGRSPGRSMLTSTTFTLMVSMTCRTILLMVWSMVMRSLITG